MVFANWTAKKTGSEENYKTNKTECFLKLPIEGDMSITVHTSHRCITYIDGAFRFRL